MSDVPWWRDSVVYQIYPRSFSDSNGDGVGDLDGITAKLDHVKELGAGAIWLSPIFVSPMADFGYDVADFTDIDPIFGDLDAFDRLLAAAHKRDLKVLLDFVPNHTSSKHAWFQSALGGKSADKRDWYVWRDGKDGGPPNNWVSVFGGSAWELDESSGQYYLHSYLKEQPDLDWRNPDVVSAMHGVLRFWLDRGVDGFRIDVIHRIAKDPALRDNPPRENPVPDVGPEYDAQEHAYDENQEDVHGFVRGIRGVVDEYKDRVTVGEVYLFDPAEVARYYGRGDELHLGFNFAFLRADWSAESFATEIDRIESALGDSGWPTLVLSNHDQPRHATRYDHEERGDQRARAAALLLCTLRGTPFLYYGEELGMRQVAVPAEQRQDPVAKTLKGDASRDGCRTPMRWTTDGGFSTGAPWLPMGDDVTTRNVAAQSDDSTSVLRAYQMLLALRNATPALSSGDYRRLEAPDGVLAWERRHGDSVAVCAVNFSAERRDFGLDDDAVEGGFRTEAGVPLPSRTSRIDLAPDEAVVLVLAAAKDA